MAQINLKEIANEITVIINYFFDKYIDLDEKLTSVKLADDKWSLKEIIGHLIDSASNNQQRFVRLQENNNLVFPAYHYNWIKIEKHNLMKFTNLMLLWKQFNILLSNIILNACKEKLDNIWIIDNEKIKLSFLITDYIRHLNEHLKHFEERLEEVKKTI